MPQTQCVLRRAGLKDLEFAMKIDLKDEGSSSNLAEQWSDIERSSHRENITRFLSSPDRSSWVHDAFGRSEPVSLGMCSFRTRNERQFASDIVYDQIDPSLFPADGRFCEVFQLWVHPDYRRLGLATELKRQFEAEARQRGIGMIYTHTEDQNLHVIEMNLKLGYREVRRGPIWDEFVRVSLVKQLEPL